MDLMANDRERNLSCQPLHLVTIRMEYNTWQMGVILTVCSRGSLPECPPCRDLSPPGTSRRCRCHCECAGAWDRICRTPQITGEYSPKYFLRKHKNLKMILWVRKISMVRIFSVPQLCRRRSSPPRCTWAACLCSPAVGSRSWQSGSGRRWSPCTQCSGSPHCTCTSNPVTLPQHAVSYSLQRSRQWDALVMVTSSTFLIRSLAVGLQ